MILTADDIDNYPAIPFNPVKNTQLFTHQKTMVSACIKHELTQEISDEFGNKKYVNFGFINDMTGAGKTLTIMSMITILNQMEGRKRLRPEVLSTTVGSVTEMVGETLVGDEVSNIRGFGGKYGASSFARARHVTVDDYEPVPQERNKTLIVVPTGLASQWDAELARFCRLNYVFVEGIKTIRDLNLESTDYQIILCKSSMLKKFLDECEGAASYRFARLFIDECDSVNIACFPTIISDFYWFVSATCDVRNNSNQLVCKNTGFIRDTYTNISHQVHLSQYPMCRHCEREFKITSSIMRQLRTTPHHMAHCTLCFHLRCIKTWGNRYSHILLSAGCELPMCMRYHQYGTGSCKVAAIISHIIADTKSAFMKKATKHRNRIYNDFNRVFDQVRVANPHTHDPIEYCEQIEAQLLQQQQQQQQNASDNDTPAPMPMPMPDVTSTAKPVKKPLCETVDFNYPFNRCHNCAQRETEVNTNFIVKHTLFRNDPEFVKQCTKMEEAQFNTINCLTPKYIMVANRVGANVMGEDVVRMINSGDYAAAAEKYGVNIQTGDNIINSIQKDITSRIKKARALIETETAALIQLKEDLEISVGELDVLKADATEQATAQVDASGEFAGQTGQGQARRSAIIKLVNEMPDIIALKTAIEDLKSKIMGAESRIKTQEDRIKSLTERQDQITKSIREVGEETCGICIDTMTVPTMTRCCKVMFCYQCITEWLNGGNASCPYCRASLSQKQLDAIVAESKDAPAQSAIDGEEILSKEDTIRRLIQTQFAPGFKALIFTEQDGSISLIESVLSKMSIKFISYRRTSSGFTNIVNYTQGDVQVVILNSVSHGAGLNLQNTSDVVLFHRMAEANETQAIGRAQRPGRTSKLNVWRLAFDGEYTVDE